VRLRAGDWVEIRSKEEILRTLDNKGRTENLPFMPQMFQYCGQRFRVYKRAHKTCDWVYRTKGRRLPNAVHLELRCDGEAYGGCQSACLIYWKEAWLRLVDDSNPSPLSHATSQPARVQPITFRRLNLSTNSTSTAEADVWAGTRAEDQQDNDAPRYICQATQVFEFTTPLPWWDFRQYLEDYISGNITFGRLIKGFIFATYTMPLRSGIGLGPPMRWIYDTFQSLWGGIPHPHRAGTVPNGQPTPEANLNLQPGEIVRVRPLKEILTTLNRNSLNRGLGFDSEMVPYCGGIYRVRTRVTKFVDEKTGKFTTMKKAAIMLDGVVCEARYSDCRMFCPRSIYPWWHEIWLERVPESSRKLGTA